MSNTFHQPTWNCVIKEFQFMITCLCKAVQFSTTWLCKSFNIKLLVDIGQDKLRRKCECHKMGIIMVGQDQYRHDHYMIGYYYHCRGTGTIMRDVEESVINSRTVSQYKRDYYGAIVDLRLDLRTKICFILKIQKIPFNHLITRNTKTDLACMIP